MTPFAGIMELDGTGHVEVRQSRNEIFSIAPRHRKPSVLANALSGTVGSVLAEAVLFPVDTIKLKVQTASATNAQGFLATLISFLRKAGIQGLYRGIGAALIKESVHSLNYWIFHGTLFRLFTEFDDTSATAPMRRLVLNLLSKQLNWLCTVPFEVISSVNQLSDKSPGFAATAHMLYKEGGLGAFYRGLTVSLILAINPAIMNTLITSILRIRAMVRQSCGEDHLDARDHSAAVVGGITALSKTIATILTYPLIRAKVLQQTAASQYAGAAFPEVLRRVLMTEGIGGLYQGMLAMSYKTILWNSLMMVFKHLLGPKRAKTPPESPKAFLQHMPHMAREPFPAEYTQEKLDEILDYLRRVGGSGKKVEALEHRLDEVSGELREMRKLLVELVARSPKNGERR
ncbi:unnamed protein product [Effrenium voratum]|uniref:Uncharacterized protein n=1 Tax=Effrenium voratum TaxID=2562239 RepID=A0AA36HTJ2_9DINO|nr:unnamed protein product [Effrenium voratum]CAJ1375012.1 unnamed protein product [Effrenium voratum]CAJ1454057.1 unnamed protein product [Effrenium voratum]